MLWLGAFLHFNKPESEPFNVVLYKIGFSHLITSHSNRNMLPISFAVLCIDLLVSVLWHVFPFYRAYRINNITGYLTHRFKLQRSTSSSQEHTSVVLVWPTDAKRKVMFVRNISKALMNRSFEFRLFCGATNSQRFISVKFVDCTLFSSEIDANKKFLLFCWR